MNCAVILTFDPDTYIYRIAVDGGSVVYAEQMLTGGDRRVAPGERVLCANASGRWVILGVIATPQPRRDDLTQLTEEEALARVSGQTLPRSNSPTEASLPSFRNLYDRKPLSVGDAVLSARHHSGRVAKSYVKVYEFGSVDIRASSNCFMYLDSVDGVFVSSCKGFVMHGPGYERSLTFKTSSLGSGDVVRKSVLREELRADPLNQTGERENGKEARLDRLTIEGFIPSPGDQYSSGYAELFLKPQARRGKREIIGEFLVTEYDNDTQTVRSRLDRVDRAAGTRSLEMFTAKGYLGKDGVGLAVHGTRTIFRNWGILEFDTDVGRMLLQIHDKKIVVDKNSISLLAGAESAIHITNTGIVMKAKSIVMDADNVAVNAKKVGISASIFGVDSDLTSISANYAIIERAWGAHIVSGAYMVASAMSINLNTYTLESLAKDVTSVLTDVKNVMSGVLTLNPDKINVVADKVFSNFKAAVDFSTSIVSDAVKATGILAEGFVDVVAGPGGVLPGVATGVTQFVIDPTLTIGKAGQFAQSIGTNAVQEAFQTTAYTAVEAIKLGTSAVTTVSETFDMLGTNIKNISDAISKASIDMALRADELRLANLDASPFLAKLESAFTGVFEVPSAIGSAIISEAGAAGGAITSALGDLAKATQGAAESAAGAAGAAAALGPATYEQLFSAPPDVTSPTFDYYKVPLADHLDPNLYWNRPDTMFGGTGSAG